MFESKTPEYEVDEIIDRCGSGDKKRYLVLWKGFQRADSTWEPESNLSKFRSKIESFNEQKRKETENKQGSLESSTAVESKDIQKTEQEIPSQKKESDHKEEQLLCNSISSDAPVSLDDDSNNENKENKEEIVEEISDTWESPTLKRNRKTKQKRGNFLNKKTLFESKTRRTMAVRSRSYNPKRYKSIDNVTAPEELSSPSKQSQSNFSKEIRSDKEDRDNFSIGSNKKAAKTKVQKKAKPPSKKPTEFQKASPSKATSSPDPSQVQTKPAEAPIDPLEAELKKANEVIDHFELDGEFYLKMEVFMGSRKLCAAFSIVERCRPDLVTAYCRKLIVKNNI